MGVHFRQGVGRTGLMHFNHAQIGFAAIARHDSNEHTRSVPKLESQWGRADDGPDSAPIHCRGGAGPYRPPRQWRGGLSARTWVGPAGGEGSAELADNVE